MYTSSRLVIPVSLILFVLLAITVPLTARAAQLPGAWNCGVAPYLYNLETCHQHNTALGYNTYGEYRLKDSPAPGSISQRDREWAYMKLDYSDKDPVAQALWDKTVSACNEARGQECNYPELAMYYATNGDSLGSLSQASAPVPVAAPAPAPEPEYVPFSLRPNEDTGFSQGAMPYGTVAPQGTSQNNFYVIQGKPVAPGPSSEWAQSPTGAYNLKSELIPSAPVRVTSQPVPGGTQMVDNPTNGQLGNPARAMIVDQCVNNSAYQSDYTSPTNCALQRINAIQGGLTREDILKINNDVQSQSGSAPTEVAGPFQNLNNYQRAVGYCDQFGFKSEEAITNCQIKAEERLDTGKSLTSTAPTESNDARIEALRDRAQGISPSRPCDYDPGGCAPEPVAMQAFKESCDAQSTKPFLFFFSRVDTEASASCVQNLQRQAGFLNNEQTGATVESRTPPPEPITGGFRNSEGNILTPASDQSPQAYYTGFAPLDWLTGAKPPAQPTPAYKLSCGDDPYCTQTANGPEYDFRTGTEGNNTLIIGNSKYDFPAYSGVRAGNTEPPNPPPEPAEVTTLPTFEWGTRDSGEGPGIIPNRSGYTFPPIEFLQGEYQFGIPDTSIKPTRQFSQARLSNPLENQSLAASVFSAFLGQ